MSTLSSDSRPIIARGPSLVARLLFLGALSIAIMALDHRQKYLETARVWLSTAAYPLQLVVQAPAQAWDWVVDSLAARERLKRENLELKAQLRVANLQLLRMAALAQENSELRAVRAASSNLQTRSLVAEILRVDLDPHRHRVLINHGSKDGVYKGQAVLDADGVFGQVTRVGQFASEVLLITDSEHATPVRVNRTGLRTIAFGTGNYGHLDLPYITLDADVKVGDLLVTSGLGGVYPAGYPVAEISSIKRDTTQTFATVEARPMAQVDHADELLLIWYTPPTTLDIDTANEQAQEQAKNDKPSGKGGGARRR